KTFESNEQIAFDSVSMTADRGYLVRGRSGTTRAVLVKFTAKGEILWSKIFNDLPHWSIISQPVSDGIILASARVPVRIFKVNDSGSVVWKKSLEINGFFLQSMGASSDNGVILAGKSSHKITLVQINPDGDVDWTAAYLLKDRLYDISSVARTSDRGYVVSGTRYSDESYETAGGFFIKLDSKQELVFQKKFGRTDRKEYAGQIFPTTNASYVIFGFSVEESDLHTLFLNVNSEGVVPNCGFFDHLSVKKMSSPHVRSQNRGIFSRDFTLSSHSIDVSQAISASSSFMACRE
ncbi:MAG TPA: hypothetical protein VLH08_22825, partial [Acidobacteriota bacterium]|nr:hypothetical protein [Acidobacteriota bacterium]